MAQADGDLAHHDEGCEPAVGAAAWPYAWGVTPGTSTGRPSRARTLIALLVALAITALVAGWLAYPRWRIEGAVRDFGIRAGSVVISDWSAWYPATGSLGDMTVTLHDANYAGLAIDEAVISAPDLRDVQVIAVHATLHGVHVPVEDGSVEVDTVRVEGDTTSLLARASIPVGDALRLRLGAGAGVIASFPYRIVGTSGWPADPAMDIEVDVVARPGD